MSKNSYHNPPPLQFQYFRDLEKLFGPPPILPEEDPEAYVALGQAIWDARPPQDFIQATRINDLTYLLWEGSRLRRLKVKLIDASKVEGAKKLIRRLDGTYRDEAYWSKWVLGNKDTVDYVNAIITKSNLDHEAILAQTVETIIETLEALERQSAQFEARRIVTIREFDQYSDNAERRREIAEERQKQISDTTTKQSKRKGRAGVKSVPQLPLDLEAAE